jgi:hypothetical protein
MTTVRERRIRRVLVALDSSPESLVAAAAATSLAAALGAELAGLFVEDRDLLLLSESRQAHRVGFLTAGSEPVDGEEMRRQLRAQAARARRALSRLAASHGISCTFEVTRGGVTTELLAAAGREDLVSVGRVGWSHGQRLRLGSTARALLARRRSHTLLAGRGSAAAAPVAVLFDGSRAAVHALRLATRLAPAASGNLVVITANPAARAEAERQLGERAGEAAFEALAGAGPEAVAAATRARRAGLLVLPLGGTGLDEDELPDLLTAVRCPVVAVS